LREYCDKHYNQLLPILAEKMHQEKVQQEKLKAVSPVLTSRRSRSTPSQGHQAEGGTLEKGSDLDVSAVRPKVLNQGTNDPIHQEREIRKKTVFKRLENGVFHRLEDKGKTISAYSSDSRRPSSIEDHLSQPWVCEETDPFTPRIRYFDLPKRTRMPSHVKTYDGSEDPEDHLKIFQAAAKVKRWAMPTCCHVFNSILTGSARRKRETTEDFVLRFKVESRDVKWAPETMRISGFIHGITNLKLIKRLHDKIPKSVDEMMRITTSFLRGETPPEKNSDGSGHCPLNWIQWQNHMAIRAIITTGEDWRRITFNLGLDEFCDSKILISIQRNHWKTQNVTGIPRHIAEHRLNIREGCPPISQKKIGQAADRNHAIQEEVEKLIDAGIMKEVHYHSWLSNPIMDVQKLNGKLASLNRFLTKSAEKSLPFFKTLKKCTKKTDFHWTEEAESVFKQMKQLIAELPTLTAPKEKEELIVYLATTKKAVSEVLMTKQEAKQMPIYFVSRALRGPEVNYTSMEKLVLALLREYAIHYRPRVSVKRQILADFIVERPEEDSLDTPKEVEEELPEPWILFTGGSSCVDGFGEGLTLTNPEEEEFTYALRFRFEATHNEDEYEDLIAGLRIAEEMGVRNLQANVDSRLVANQVNETSQQRKQI
nr:reverse transcriptase domain-containing protein [Tanacetum cinerariifolium]